MCGQIVIHLVTWYCFSASATFTNKVLIKQHHVSAEMLTLSHLFVSVICDCTCTFDPFFTVDRFVALIWCVFA